MKLQVSDAGTHPCIPKQEGKPCNSSQGHSSPGPAGAWAVGVRRVREALQHWSAKGTTSRAEGLAVGGVLCSSSPRRGAQSSRSILLLLQGRRGEEGGT